VTKCILLQSRFVVDSVVTTIHLAYT